MCELCKPSPDLAAAVADLFLQSQSISRELKSPPATGSVYKKTGSVYFQRVEIAPRNWICL